MWMADFRSLPPTRQEPKGPNRCGMNGFGDKAKTFLTSKDHDEHDEHCIALFQELLRFRTISQEGPKTGAYHDCATWLVDATSRLGMESKVGSMCNTRHASEQSALRDGQHSSCDTGWRYQSYSILAIGLTRLP
jgi:hypothetical protein